MTWIGVPPWVAEDFEKAASSDKRRRSGSPTWQDGHHTCIESHLTPRYKPLWGTSWMRSGPDGSRPSIAEAEAPLALMTRAGAFLGF